jgi:hypothetical protein
VGNRAPLGSGGRPKTGAGSGAWPCDSVSCDAEFAYPESRNCGGCVYTYASSSSSSPPVRGRLARLPRLCRSEPTARFSPDTIPPPNVRSLGEGPECSSTHTDRPTDDDASSVGLAVARNGFPGSTLNAAGGSRCRFAGGGGTGERRVWRGSSCGVGALVAPG